MSPSPPVAPDPPALDIGRGCVLGLLLRFLRVLCVCWLLPAGCWLLGGWLLEAPEHEWRFGQIRPNLGQLADSLLKAPHAWGRSPLRTQPGTYHPTTCHVAIGGWALDSASFPTRAPGLLSLTRALSLSVPYSSPASSALPRAHAQAKHPGLKLCCWILYALLLLLL